MVMNRRVYVERRYYSAVHDRDMARISMVNRHNGELFIEIPDDGRQTYRDLRNRALEALEDAVLKNQAPGPVEFEIGVPA